MTLNINSEPCRGCGTMQNGPACRICEAESITRIAQELRTTMRKIWIIPGVVFADACKMINEQMNLDLPEEDVLIRIPHQYAAWLNQFLCEQLENGRIINHR